MNDFILLGCGPEPTRLWNCTPLFDVDDGRKLLDYCDKHGAAVLGIEGFKVVGDKRTPDLDCIADFSALTISGRGFPALSRAAARDFLDSISNVDTLMEFTLVTI